MVIPFLSLYLTQDLGFSLEKVGLIMTCFGLGSLCGAWVGGRLTDIFGPYKVMFYSLLFTGTLFVLLQYATSFVTVCIGIFFLMIIADAFRPATFVALSLYSKPENKTRSVTLIRLAINLGFSAGPALGGLIIAYLGYSGLFWVDGITCIVAAWLLLRLLNPKKSKVLDDVRNTNPKSAYSDGAYLLFVFTMVIFGFVFVQYFSTVPLFYNEARGLSEAQIGVLLAMNGFLIFLFEMPLIKYLESTSISKIGHMIFGLTLVTLSLLILNSTSWNGILVIGMLLMTLGEMIAFPFSNAFAMQRAKRGNQGEYMALYSIAFSASHIFAHNTGLITISNFGFSFTWYAASIIGLVGILLLLLLRRISKTK